MSVERNEENCGFKISILIMINLEREFCFREKLNIFVRKRKNWISWKLNIKRLKNIEVNLGS